MAKVKKNPLGRLTAADYLDGRFYHYAYDSVGNRVMAADQYSTKYYTYDLSNRMTGADGVNYTWDNNGNLLNDGANTYTYDPANHLTGVVSPSATVNYAYNGLGDRLQQTVNGVPIDYTLDLNAGLTQVLSDGTTSYAYGLDRLSQQSGNTPEYFLSDALGSVRQITNANSDITLAKTYDPYGNVVQTLGTSQTAFGFTGQQTDTNGLQYLRARYYAPDTGRFLTQDPFSGYANIPLSENPYTYGLNNPILYTDPSGQSSLSSAFGHPLNASLSPMEQLAQSTGNGPCIQWDQLLMYGGAQALASTMNATVLWNANSSYLSNYINGARDQWFNDVTWGAPSYFRE